VKHLRELDALEDEPGDNAGLTGEEKVLMKILKQYIRTTPLTE
jgi:hypothetical protein